MTAIYQSRELADRATEKLKVYAQPQRLMILSYLLQGESTVSDIDNATAIGQPALSQQLAELRRAKVVKTRREGKQIWYDLADDTARLCVKTMEALLKDEPDHDKLVQAATSSPPSSRKKDRPASAGAAGFAKIL
ncbi:ArsR/SmtB family transcription factor [Parasphingorhabdus halotolerans]|uniref:Winged helix-turn-helix transcriptional regulator n=1 Tax=Parasphingorhabdus halotolerans TaxID=2725558 RepID=A0A6H2DQ05_9SPHN|nr:metalloregulator ArsR/SmtB family transcription factor [Parasphingorhabdus halotolerans]QJB70470.1 winged helix-turn-helix transcriptional regulator [Parasphingorhabdus halotolerans]